ncbi:MAG: hypothetical protein LBB74_04035 [Chitinispirillales bacterium]|nr:hypothetical protein [Chitinispirillales bacterium]
MPKYYFICVVTKKYIKSQVLAVAVFFFLLFPEASVSATETADSVMTAKTAANAESGNRVYDLYIMSIAHTESKRSAIWRS